MEIAYHRYNGIHRLLFPMYPKAPLYRHHRQTMAGFAYRKKPVHYLKSKYSELPARWLSELHIHLGKQWYQKVKPDINPLNSHHHRAMPTGTGSNLPEKRCGYKVPQSQPLLARDCKAIH